MVGSSRTNRAPDIEQILDQPHLGGDAAFDDFQRALARRRIGAVDTEDLRPPENGAQWRAQVVRYLGQELVLDAVGRPRFSDRTFGACLRSPARLVEDADQYTDRDEFHQAHGTRFA